jgi:hypothetical protein
VTIAGTERSGFKTMARQSATSCVPPSSPCRQSRYACGSVTRPPAASEDRGLILEHVGPELTRWAIETISLASCHDMLPLLLRRTTSPFSIHILCPNANGTFPSVQVSRLMRATGPMISDGPKGLRARGNPSSAAIPVRLRLRAARARASSRDASAVSGGTHDESETSP